MGVVFHWLGKYVCCGRHPASAPGNHFVCFKQEFCFYQEVNFEKN